MNNIIIRVSSTISNVDTYNVSLISGLKKIFPGEQVAYVTNNSEFVKKLRLNSVKLKLFKIPFGELDIKEQLLKAVILSPFYVGILLKALLSLSFRRNDSVILLQSTVDKILLTLALKGLQYKVIWIEHRVRRVTRRAFIMNNLYMLMGTFTDSIIAVSQATLDDLSESKMESKKLFLIRTGVDTTYFTPSLDEEISKKKEHLKLSGRFIIGYISQISSDNGLGTFIDVSEYLLEKDPSLRFLLVGEGEFLENAKKRVKDLGIEKYYTFAPYSKDTRGYFSVIDLFFSPTKYIDGLSIELLKAASMEKIIVANDIGENRELIVSNETGYLYKEKNDEEVANLLLNIVKKEKENISIMKAARAKVENRFNIEHMAIQYNGVITNLFKNK